MDLHDTQKFENGEKDLREIRKLSGKFELPGAKNFTCYLEQNTSGLVLNTESSIISENSEEERFIIRLEGLPIGIYTIFKKESKIIEIEYAGKIPFGEQKKFESVILRYSNGKRLDSFLEIPFP